MPSQRPFKKRKRRKDPPDGGFASEYIAQRDRTSRLAALMHLATRPDLRLMELRLAVYLQLRCRLGKLTKLSGRQLARELSSKNPNHLLEAARQLAELGLIKHVPGYRSKSKFGRVKFPKRVTQAK